jgi:hypothetical protein
MKKRGKKQLFLFDAIYCSNEVRYLNSKVYVFSSINNSIVKRQDFYFFLSTPIRIVLIADQKIVENIRNYFYIIYIHIWKKTLYSTKHKKSAIMDVFRSEIKVKEAEKLGESVGMFLRIRMV